MWASIDFLATCRDVLVPLPVRVGVYQFYIGVVETGRLLGGRNRPRVDCLSGVELVVAVRAGDASVNGVGVL